MKPHYRKHQHRIQLTTEAFAIEVSTCMDSLSPDQSLHLFKAVTQFMERGSVWPYDLEDSQVRELYERTIKYLKNPELLNVEHLNS